MRPDSLKIWFDRAADAGVECYRALYRFARSSGKERPEVNSEALRTSLEVLFATLPDDSRQWPRTLQTVFETWGIAVPSHLGASLLIDARAFVGFREALREHSTLMPIEGGSASSRPITPWMREP
jgi:hypothetical protein